MNDPKQVKVVSKSEKATRAERQRIARLGKRAVFWKYCIRASNAARARAREKHLPFSIDAHFIDELLVDQRCKCAISGLPFDLPEAPSGRKNRHQPFAPALDRIIPSLGYVEGNVRLVCNIVNMAMSDWGLETLLILSKALAAKETELYCKQDDLFRG